MHPVLDGLAVWFSSAVRPAHVMVDGVPRTPSQLAGALLLADGAAERVFPPQLAAALADHLRHTDAAATPLSWEEAATGMIYAFAGNLDAARAHLYGVAAPAEPPATGPHPG
ncbi:MAG TPA: hypothetical protein VK453_06440 [Micromonosporaceae bacterium]|nr:hypothetical protein [Micromonosporaceae bacterium]